MTHRTIRGLLSLTFAASIAATNAPTVVAEETSERILASRSAAIVTVKFLLKIKAGNQEQEIESEISGVMMDPMGLVLCSDTQTGGFSTRMGRGGVTATPTDIKILVGDDNEGVEAKLLARDSELDLAWIEVKEPPAKSYAFVDFKQASSPKVGQPLYALRRMDKQFDRVVVLSQGWTAGTVRKPRELYVPGGTVGSAMGLPVFTADGKPLGVSITQQPDDEDSEGGGRLARALNLRGGSPPLLLPCAEVLSATQRARDSAATRKEEKEDDTATEKAKDEKSDTKSTEPEKDD